MIASVSFSPSSHAPALIVIHKFVKARHSGIDCRNPGYMDVFKFAIPGTGYPLPGGYDELRTYLCITMSAPAWELIRQRTSDACRGSVWWRFQKFQLLPAKCRKHRFSLLPEPAYSGLRAYVPPYYHPWHWIPASLPE